MSDVFSRLSLSRNRVLQVGIRAVVSLVRTRTSLLPFVLDGMLSYHSILVELFGCCSRCMRYVRKYYRYLLCCSVLLGGLSVVGE